MTEKTIFWEGTPIKECSREELMAAVRYLTETRAAGRDPQPVPIKPEAVRNDAGWRWYHSYHLKTTVVTAPTGVEYELRDGDVTTSRVDRLLNAMLEALNRKGTP